MVDDSSKTAPLPPVEPPSAGFLIQLFVIPMVIVSIIVLVWLMFSWLAQMGSDPRQLVQDLRSLNDASWQKALTLADILRNREYDYVRRDPEMAGELAGLLAEQLETGSRDPRAVKLRVFLCRALGEFQVPEVVPPLLEAAQLENGPEDIDVRRAALEALAVFAANNDPGVLRSDARTMEVLRSVSREAHLADREQRAELRSAAAFALGVVGGEEALDRLEVLTSDAHTNTRYNAALGLARHGDLRAEPVLLEMLDPENATAAEGETHEEGQASKRLLVIKNGIRGVAELAQQNEARDLAELTNALRLILDSDLSQFPARVRRGIRLQAEDALLAIADANSVNSLRTVPQ